MNNFSNFKSKILKSILNEITDFEIISGRIGDNIYKCRNKDNSVIYIKHSLNNILQVTEDEMVRLTWLNENQSAILIPKVICFEKSENESILILSAIQGSPSQKAAKEIGIKESVIIVAKALKNIHGINIKSSTKLPKVIPKMLNDIEKSMSQGKLLNKRFTEVNKQTPEQILDYLISNKSLFQETILVHGDYCLPNIIIDTSANSYGVIDWSECGIGDKYFDFAAIEGSIVRNFGKDYVNIFYENYGEIPERINREKIKYCQLIDQFSYNKVR